MKEVYVTLKGRGVVYWFENFTETPTDWDMVPLDDFWQLEEDGWIDGDLNERAFLLELDGVWIGGDGFVCDEDITEKKGKYIKSETILKEECRLEAPFYVLPYNCGTTIENTFRIELQDDEEFDPKKLQLVKSDYEVEFLPYGIISDYVIYDGKEIVMDNEVEYRDRRDDAFICYEFYK